jgi:hypothetical protein
MSPQTSPTDVGGAFDAAKAMFEAAKDLTKTQQEQALRWVAESLGLTTPAVASPLPPLSPPPPPAAPPSQEGVDIASFLKGKRPRSDVQFVTVVAHYYKFDAPVSQRRDTIDAEIAQDATRTGGWDRLKSPTDTLRNAKNQGYLNSSGRGLYSINAVGENLVARSLPGDGDDSPKKRVVRKKKPVAKRKPTKKRG